MDASAKIGLAALILLLLPPIVAELEARRLANIFYAALAIGGLVYALLAGGPTAAANAALAGLGCLALLSAGVAGAVILWERRVLTGGHIKLLSAGAAWLGIAATGAMLLIASAGILFFIVSSRITYKKPKRPAMTMIMSISLIVTFIFSGFTG